MSDATQGRAVEAPVAEVTLLEDRARVLRRGTLTLEVGAHRLMIEGVSPVLVDKTLGARIAGVTTSVRVVRRGRHRAEQRPEQRRAHDEAILAKRDEIEVLEQRLRRLQDALRLAHSAAQQMLDDLVLDASWSAAREEARARSEEAGEPEDWLGTAEARLDELQARERASSEESIEVAAEIEDAIRELKRLERRRDETERPSDTLGARLVLDCDVAEAGDHTLEIDYLVPSACWRPAHRATLSDSGAVRFETEASVWQNTGEDWNDAQLRFSTQRASLGAEPPRLSTEELRVKRKSEVLEVETREQTIEQTGLEGGEPPAPELPGIDDGGDALELRAPDLASVPSDGRPRRVPLFDFTADASVSLTCAPELTPAVLYRTRQANESAMALLAGPVDLIKGGGHVGRTSILYVAPSERFELGWGPEPALRVHRAVTELETESSMLRNWYYETTHVKNRLSNLGPEALEVELVERVPVSEIEKVKIEVDLDETSERKTPDADGFLRWTVALAPFARATIEVRTTVQRHSDVVGL